MKTLHPVTSSLVCAFALAIAVRSHAADPLPPTPAPAPTSAVKNMLSPTSDVKAWQFELNEDATGTIKADDGAIALAATKVDGTDWHVQAYQTGVEFKDAKEYVVTFKAKASTKRSAQLYAGVNEDDYHSIGLDELIDLTPAWQDFKFTFKADGTAGKNNRLGFIIGQDTGTVYIKDLVLTAK